MMKKDKRTFWRPLLSVVLSFIAAVLCNIGATADPAGEMPILNMIMTLAFIAAWIYFFVSFRSRSKTPFIISLVYWAFVLLYAAVNNLGVLSWLSVDAFFLTGTPLVLVPMALLAPLMGLIVVLESVGIAAVLILGAVFTGLSIYRLCKKSDG